MATRTLTTKFENYRTQFRSSSSTKRSRTGENGSLLSDSSLDSDDLEDPRQNHSIPSSLPPEWVDIVDSVHKSMAKIKDSLRTLSKLHTARLKITFGDEIIAEQERDIEILTGEITKTLKQAETQVKSIASINNAGQLSAQERTVRINVMRSLASEIQTQSKNFRNAQKEFLKNLSAQEKVGADFGFDDDKESRKVLSDEDALDRGLTADQMTALEDLNQRANEREKEIIRIAQSINELSQLFKELNVLVIEQGTILDRIDYNIEQTVVRVSAGVQELEKADEYSKKAYTLKCILCLIVLIVILIVVLVALKS
jgi:syntaxin 16